MSISTIKSIMKAYSLIELIVAVAVLGVLAAIAAPAYRNYVVRSYLSEGIGLMNEFKITVEKFYLKKNRLPTSAEVATKTVSGNVINQIAWTYVNASQGQIVTNYGNKVDVLNNRNLWLQANIQASGNIAWTCMTDTNGSKAIDSMYLPSDCK